MRRKIIILLIFISALFTVSGLCAADTSTQRLIRRGVELFDAGRWSDARHEMLQARGELPLADRYERQRVDYYLAVCAVELRQEDAQRFLHDFLRLWPESIYANDIRFLLATDACAKGNLAQAEKSFAEVNYKLLDARRREQYDLRMGYLAFSKQHYDQAQMYFSRIGAASSYADHALYYKTYIDYLERRNGAAKQGFRRLQSSAAYGTLAPYYLLQLEFAEANYTYVVEQGDALIAKAAKSYKVEVERMMAEAWSRLGDFNKTINYLFDFKRDGGVMGRDENYLLGYALYRTARYDQAEELLRRACGADDALTQNASYHLADCYVRRGAKREASQSFSQAANEAFDAAIAEDALFNCGKLQYELGGGVFNEAINLLTRYLEKYPRSKRADQARQLLVAAYYNSLNYEAAYAAIKAVENPDGDLKQALQKIAYFRALEAFQADDLTLAKRLLAEASEVAVSPKYNALVLFWQGEVAYAEDDYATAAARYEAYLKRAPRSAPEYAMAHYNMGYSRFSQQRMADAKSHFTSFLTLHTATDGYRADGWSRLGDTQFATRAFGEAAASYDKALAIGGVGRYYAYYQKAITLGLLQKTPAKIEALKRIVAAREGDYLDDATYELGRTYVAQEQFAEGVRTLEKFIADYPSSLLRPQALSDLGLAYLNLGDHSKSLKYYDMVVAASPRSAEAKGAMEGIRDIYVSKGDVDAYFDYTRKVGLESDVTLVARDSLTFTAAQRLYMAEQHAQAAQALQNYVELYPKGYYLIDALYCLSDSYLRISKRNEAIETLKALTSEGINSYSETALERLSSMTYVDKRYAEAATAYRRLYDVARTTTARNEAMTGYVRATIAGGDKSQIESMCADVVACADAGMVAVRESQYAFAEQLREAGEWSDAVKVYRKLAAEVKSVEGAAAAYYVLKENFEEGNAAKTEKAIYAYIDKNTPHAYWLAKAYILLGDTYKKKGDMFQARATYQSVADGYSPANDGIMAEVKERIAKLN